MHQEFNKTASYQKNLTLLCISLILFGFGCILLGYLFLPFAAASYACLLHYEKKTRRIFSYVIPVAIYTINVLINGFFSLEAVIYVAVGAMLFLFYSKGRNKRETVFFTTLAISVFLLLSFLAVGCTINGSLSFSALRVYYAGIYNSLKRVFITVIAGLSAKAEDGTLFFLFSRENAEDVFHSILLSLPSFVIILAFLLTGVTHKIYDFLRVRILSASKNDLELFVPTKFLAYTYIIFAVLSLFSSASTDLFALTVTNVYNVLLAVFAYFGLKIAYSIVKAARGSLFALLLLAVAFALFSSTAITLLSFIDIFFTLSSTQQIKEN